MIEIDLTGPDGNVFNLISMAMDLGKALNKRRGAQYLDISKIREDMMSKDYEHAIKVFDKHFGHMVILYR